MFKYETHLHTSPASRCARATVEENLKYYKELGYDGIFITNHFIDGNINADQSASFEDKLQVFFADYEEALALAPSIGIRVFLGIETSYKGTDFLVYGLSKEWYFAHPEINEMKTKEKLELMAKDGALIIQAHPFREAGYIDHIRLFPRNVHGIEVINAGRTDFENDMAELYAKSYRLLRFAGSDNHVGPLKSKLAGMCADTPILNELDFVHRILTDRMEIFTLNTEA